MNCHQICKIEGFMKGVFIGTFILKRVNSALSVPTKKLPAYRVFQYISSKKNIYPITNIS